MNATFQQNRRLCAELLLLSAVGGLSIPLTGCANSAFDATTFSQPKLELTRESLAKLIAPAFNSEILHPASCEPMVRWVLANCLIGMERVEKDGVVTIPLDSPNPEIQNVNIRITPLKDASQYTVSLAFSPLEELQDGVPPSKTKIDFSMIEKDGIVNCIGIVINVDTPNPTKIKVTQPGLFVGNEISGQACIISEGAEPKAVIINRSYSPGTPSWKVTNRMNPVKVPANWVSESPTECTELLEELKAFLGNHTPKQAL